MKRVNTKSVKIHAYIDVVKGLGSEKIVAINVVKNFTLENVTVVT